jgi:hypothetical protein
MQIECAHIHGTLCFATHHIEVTSRHNNWQPYQLYAMMVNDSHHKELVCVVHRDENGTDIFRPYSRPNPFKKGFNPSVSESGYLTSDTVFVSEYLNHIFMMSIPNRILSGIFYTIRIRIRIRT